MLDLNYLNAPNDLLLNGTNIYLGLVQNAASGAPCFKGKMDEVRIWNRALTTTEIIAGMYTQIPADASGLEVYYPFNQNAGTLLANNAFGFTGHGTLFNFNNTD